MNDPDLDLLELKRALRALDGHILKVEPQMRLAAQRADGSAEFLLRDLQLLQAEAARLRRMLPADPTLLRNILTTR